MLDALDRSASRDPGAARRAACRAKGELDIARSELADALRHVAVVRYDAFGDMGGRMSFTAALLDDSGDGLVITSINGRTEARCYAKGVKEGQRATSRSRRRRPRRSRSRSAADEVRAWTTRAGTAPRGTPTSGRRARSREAGAALAAGGGQGAERVPCVSVADALDAVRRGDVAAALVPLENSVEGSVAETLDELATGELLQIIREVQLPV